MKPRYARLILILLPLAVLPFFQNCAKSQSEQLLSGNSKSCIGSNEGVCGLAVPDGEKIDFNLNRAEIEWISSPYSGDYNLKFSIASDVVVNTQNSNSCGLKFNNRWLQLKQLLLNNGLCNYSFNVPPDYARCMAMVVPSGYIIDSSSESRVGIWTSMCQDDYSNICGKDNIEKFNQEITTLISEIQKNQGCDP